MVKLYQILAAHGQRIALGVGLLISVVFLLSVFAGMEEFSQLSKQDSYGTHIFDFGLIGAIFMTVFAIGALVFFGIYQVATHFRQSIKGIIGMGVLIAIFFLLYTTASGEATGPIAATMEKVGGITPGILKFIKAGTTSMLLMILASFLILIAGEIRNALK